MIIICVGFGLLVIAVLVGCWFLADWIVPQSDIDKIEAIGRWAREELERREAEKNHQKNQRTTKRTKEPLKEPKEQLKEPTRPGHWKPFTTEQGRTLGVYCSECKQFLLMNPTPYCPNCGAKMDEEEQT